MLVASTRGSAGRDWLFKLQTQAADHARLADHREDFSDLGRGDLLSLPPTLPFRLARKVRQGKQTEELVRFVDDR
jgi:hypothetical protein